MINKQFHPPRADKFFSKATQSLMRVFLCVLCDIFSLRFFARTFFFIFIPIAIGLSFLISSCTPELDAPKPASGYADFTKTIAMGGNYMSGYQDGALYLKGQQFSIAALIAQQLELVGAEHFNQSLMPIGKGLGLRTKPWETGFVAASTLQYKTDCKGVTTLYPVFDTISVSNATPYLTGIAGNGVQNFAVPFAAIPDYFNPAFGNTYSSGNKNPYYNRLASNPGVSTLYEDAKAQDMTFLIAWLGMEDVYNYAGSGGTGAAISSSASFNASLNTILNGLIMNGEGDEGVIANIPDFRSFPYYTLVKWNGLELTQAQADSLNNHYKNTLSMPQINFVAGKNGYIINDAAATGGYRQLHSGEYITLSVPMDSLKCFNYGLLPNPVNDYYVLDSAEVVEIDQAINSYNTVIMQKVNEYNLAFADMHYYFNTVTTGVKWNGTHLNAEFINGGFFSLDGYHPNQKGYALIANEFIRAINSKYNSIIPTVNCVECDGILFP